MEKYAGLRYVMAAHLAIAELADTARQIGRLADRCND